MGHEPGERENHKSRECTQRKQGRHSRRCDGAYSNTRSLPLLGHLRLGELDLLADEPRGLLREILDQCAGGALAQIVALLDRRHDLPPLSRLRRAVGELTRPLPCAASYRRSLDALTKREATNPARAAAPAVIQGRRRAKSSTSARIRSASADCRYPPSESARTATRFTTSADAPLLSVRSWSTPD